MADHRILFAPAAMMQILKGNPAGDVLAKTAPGMFMGRLGEIFNDKFVKREAQDQQKAQAEANKNPLADILNRAAGNTEGARRKKPRGAEAPDAGAEAPDAGAGALGAKQGSDAAFSLRSLGQAQGTGRSLLGGF